MRREDRADRRGGAVENGLDEIVDNANSRSGMAAHLLDIVWQRRIGTGFFGHLATNRACLPRAVLKLPLLP